ncbi:hypothetical protein ACJMK2_003948 [Sinanodonta woodiana]|uniref:Uncharacterized protein n=1 Tax=Sinanodonta woodiana TaxID=1069815 RepID=A0ABD3Y2R7_SINWO
MNNLTITGLLCGAFTIFCCTWAVASSQWLTTDIDNFGEVQFGLWKKCSSNYNTSHWICGFKDTYPSWITATILLQMAGNCLILADVVLAIVLLFIPKWKHAVRKGAGLYSISGGLIIAIGAIVWTASYKTDPDLTSYHLSTGFSLAILTVVMSVITGSVLFLGRKKEPGEHSYTAI